MPDAVSAPESARTSSMRGARRGITHHGARPGGAVLALCALALVAGCAARPNLAKATFPRTTVPASGSSVSGGSSSSGATNVTFSLATLSRTDPCGLLDNSTLAALGAPAAPSASGFDACSDYMKDTGGNELNVTVTLGSSIDDTPNTVIFGMPVAEKPLADGSGCYERIITQNTPTEGIEIEVDGKDPCTPARKLAQTVVSRMRTNPPTRSDYENSLAGYDPCKVVDDNTAAATVGANPSKSRDSLYKCDWQGADTDLTVAFALDQDPKTDDALGTPMPVDLGNGITAYSVLTTDVFPACEVKWIVKPGGSDANQIADVEFDDINKINVDVCAKADAVAKVVQSNLPTLS
ncbi:MAG TPA: hypothetical protein VG756_25445 [Pseudonocardiaceae bacterium]|nr:hypothetical protein [Pseudonocardiaceae bacterium]